MTKMMIFFQSLILGSFVLLSTLRFPHNYVNSFSMATPKPSKNSKSAKEDPLSLSSSLSTPSSFASEQQSINDGLSSVHDIRIDVGKVDSSTLQESTFNNDTTATTTTTSSLQQQQQQQQDPSSESQQKKEEKKRKKNTSVGIVLNTNARQVSTDLVPIVKEMLGSEYVHVTNTADEARVAARTLLQQNVSIIIPVGGDGTLSSMINFLCQERINLSQQQEQGQRLKMIQNHGEFAAGPTPTTNSTFVNGDGTRQLQDAPCATDDTMTIEDAMDSLPLIGYIPLGTGNGLGSVVACEYPTKCRNKSLLSKVGTRIRSLMRRKENNEKENGEEESNTLKNTKQQDLQNLLALLVQVGNEIQDKGEHHVLEHSSSNSISPTSSSSSDPMNLVNIVEIPMMELTSTVPNQRDQEKKEDTQDSASSSSTSELCFFAGVGFDSLMLEDFKVLKAWSHRTKIFTSALSSVLGYCVALVTRTLPKCITRSAHQVNVRISTRDPETLWVDHRRGDIVQRAVQQPNRNKLTAQRNAMLRTVGDKYNGNVYERNGRSSSDGISTSDDDQRAVLYEGMAGIVAGATTPFYGGGLRLFPFARMTIDKMHLRIGRIHPLRGFVNIPRIFAGSYRDTRESSHGCIDFVGDDFEVTILPASKPETNSKTSTANGSYTQEEEPGKHDPVGYPLQHSGESIGNCEKVRLRVVKEPIRFVTFLEKRLTQDGPGRS